MERVLLYYPTIEFPNENWLKQSILFSDKVSSILPYYTDKEYPDSIKYLIDAGEYTPVFIQHLIEENLNEYNDFTNIFLKEIDNNSKILTASSRSIHSRNIDCIFKAKFTNRIFCALKKRNLILKETDTHIVLLENVGLYYMSILAKFVSSVTTQDLVIPSTDYKRFSRISFENGIESDQALNLIFENCLPVPNDSVELSKIIKFKHSHKNDLIRFRHFYTDTQNSLRECRDSNDVKECLIGLNEKIVIELAELKQLYSTNKLKVFYTSLNSLFGLDNPALFNSLITAGLISTTIDSKIGLGIGAILVAGKVIDNIVSKPNRTSEFNYLFEAQRKGII